jgi:hypothetical protein
MISRELRGELVTLAGQATRFRLVTKNGPPEKRAT